MEKRKSVRRRICRLNLLGFVMVVGHKARNGQNKREKKSLFPFIHVYPLKILLHAVQTFILKIVTCMVYDQSTVQFFLKPVAARHQRLCI